MTLPPQDNDPRPVVLQEPERDLAPVWQTTANKGFVLRPEEDGVPGLHPGWAKVLAPEETPLWQGRPVAIGRSARDVLPLFIFGFIGLVMVLNMGLEGGIVPFLMVAAFLFIRQKIRAAKTAAAPDRIYLLTNRAAYLARQYGAGLSDITAYPITPQMTLKQGPQSVVFASRPGRRGAIEDVGFIGIADAAHVFGLMQEAQRHSQT